ncbi:MAG: hypothetical protein AB7E47_04335 [Desulfovibrionaceae bacterium]
MGKWYDFKTSVSFRRTVIFNVLQNEDQGLSTHGAPGQEIAGDAKYPLTNRFIFQSAVLEYQKQPTRQKAGFLYRLFLDASNNRHRRPHLMPFDIQAPPELENTIRFRFADYNVQPGSEPRSRHQGTRPVKQSLAKPDPFVFKLMTDWLEPMLEDIVESDHLDYERVGLLNGPKGLSEEARQYLAALNANFRNAEGKLVMNVHTIGINL